MKYNTTKPKLLAAMIFAALTATAPALAATQGTLGATSTGSVNINVTKDQLVEISDLTDLTLTHWKDGDAAPQLTSNACVYSTRPNGGYSIKATGSGASGAFTISDGASNAIPYSVAWNSAGVGALANTGDDLAVNTAKTGLTHAATDSSTCNGATPGDTARLIVNISTAAMTAAPDGLYTGTLTLLVSPV